MAVPHFVTILQLCRYLARQTMGVCLDYNGLIFRGIDRLFWRESLLRRSNKWVYLFFRVFEVEYVLAYQINL